MLTLTYIIFQVALVLAVVLALASAQLGLGGLGGLGHGLGSGLSYSSGGSLGGGSLGGGSSGGHGHEVIYDYYVRQIIIILFSFILLY